MLKSKEEFKLLPDEDIVIETKHIESKEEKVDIKFLLSTLGLGGAIILTVGSFMMFNTLNFNFDTIEIFASIILIVGGLFIISIIIYLSNNRFNDTRMIFYITTTRMIQATEKGAGIFIEKEIVLTDISHLIDWGHTLEIIPKKLDANGYYKGYEEEIIPKAQNSMFHRVPNSIMIWLRGSRGKRVIKKFKAFLIEKVPLKQHQNLEFLYIAEN